MVQSFKELRLERQLQDNLLKMKDRLLNNQYKRPIGLTENEIMEILDTEKVKHLVYDEFMKLTTTDDLSHYNLDYTNFGLVIAKKFDLKEFIKLDELELDEHVSCAIIDFVEDFIGSITKRLNVDMGNDISFGFNMFKFKPMQDTYNVYLAILIQEHSDVYNAIKEYNVVIDNSNDEINE